MEWVPVKDRTRMPKPWSCVLATVVSIKDKEKYVVPCDYGPLADAVTGEIYGDNTFISYQQDNLTDCSIDYDDRETFKTIAWMPYPKPFVERFAVIIAGSRTFSDYTLLENKLDTIFKLRKPTSILCGLAEGADRLGKRYAEERKIKVDCYPADWAKLGKGAGFIRNEQMANHADAAVCFWDGHSSGTKHMIETMKKRELPVRVVKF